MQNGRTQQNHDSMGFSNRKGQKLPTCLTLKNSEHRAWLVQCTEFYLAWKLSSSACLLRTGYLYILNTGPDCYWVLPGVEVVLLSLPLQELDTLWLFLLCQWISQRPDPPLYTVYRGTRFRLWQVIYIFMNYYSVNSPTTNLWYLFPSICFKVPHHHLTLVTNKTN